MRQLQHLVRMRQVQRRAGRVVQHRHRHVHPRPVLLDQAAHHRHVGAVRAARHRQQPHAGLRQSGVLDRPARVVDQHRVARRQEGAGDQVQAVRRADGAHDLVGAGLHGDVQQPARQRAPQALVAQRLAVARQQRVVGLSGQPAQRRLQQGQVQPFRGKRAQAGGAPRVRLEHAADQRAGVDGGRQWRRRRGWGEGRTDRQGAGFANEKPSLLARLQQTLREQLVIGGHHRVGTDAVMARAVPHRGQPRARQQQPLLDPRREALRQLLRERLAGIARKNDRRDVRAGGRAQAGAGCAGVHADTDDAVVWRSVLVLCWSRH